MLAEKERLATSEETPVWDRENDRVVWRGISYPWLVFYLIHVTTKNLIALLWNDRRNKWDPKEKIRFGTFSLERFYKLVWALHGISDEAFFEAFDACLAFDRFLENGEESERQRVIHRLENIRRLLHLDELFERKVVQE